MLKVYTYEKCSTCKKALSWLTARGMPFEVLPIVERPPSIAELRTMLTHVGDLKKLFNTSGELYREMKMSERLPELKEEEALELLSKHGKLVKRPFVLSNNSGCVGFKEDEWASKL
ncbi:MAG: Spx/MgsR family RNA polymerase-binding regulatory protein [Betaproteobacteria bacterium]|nr:Spx/MgsR family RNA polymerase-binding regulatory protein [Betaproteobacteria bacterium]